MTAVWASVSTVDLGRLVDVCQALEEAGVDGIHVDVSDGVFAPDLTFGYRVVAALSTRLRIPVEAHLMVTSPEGRLREVADAGAARASFHVEAAPYPWRVIGRARSIGIVVGVAINPVTPLASLEYLLPGVDFVNVLTTEPDDRGERLLPSMDRRVASARALTGGRVSVQVDGGVAEANIAGLSAAGASEFVVGRALVDRDAMADVLVTLRSVT
jgi:ribulose-phosphate 3-epimerase